MLQADWLLASMPMGQDWNFDSKAAKEALFSVASPSLISHSNQQIRVKQRSRSGQVEK